MRRLKYVPFALSFALTVGMPLAAQTSNDPASSASCFGFDAALERSATLSATIGENAARRDAADAALRQTRAQRWPQVSAYGRTATSGGNGLLDGRTDNQVGLEAQQRIFDFGKAKFETDAARARLKGADYALVQSEDDHYLETALHYIAVLEGEERLLAAQQRSENYQAMLDGLPRQLEVNIITLAEANSIRAQAAVAQANLIEEKLALQTAMAELFVLTDTPRSVCAQLPTRLTNSAQIALSEEIGWIDSVVERHNAVKASQAEIDAARADYKYATRTQLPTVSASGVVAYVYDDVLNQWEQEERIGLNLSTPLWGGGQYDAAKDGARARQRIAEQSLAHTRRELLADITTTLRQVLSGEALIGARRAATQSLADEVDAVQREFENGLRPYQDVEATEAELQSARLQEISAKYNLRLQQVRLLYLQQNIAPTPTD